MKPLESTLKQHELRPYSVQRDYRRELLRSTRGASPLSSHGQEIKQENMQLQLAKSDTMQKQIEMFE